MAYSTSNPPRLVSQPIAGQREWQLVTTDASATVRVTGYISNADDLGMKVNDLVTLFDTTNGIVSTLKVASVTAGGAANLADATVVGSATNTD